MAAHSSFLAWEVLWTEEPDGPQSLGSRGQRAWQTTLYQTHTHTRSVSLSLSLCVSLTVSLPVSLSLCLSLLI